MLKDHRIVRRVSGIIRDASDEVMKDVLSVNSELRGREEEVTAQLKSEITLHLMEKIQAKLNDKTIKGVHFGVYTFRKVEEKQVGADLLGLLDINLDGQTLTKGYLAQAKVGTAFGPDDDHLNARCRDDRLLGQIDNMLKVSPASYVFIYTRKGVFVVPASDAQSAGSNSINTEHIYNHRFGSFYEEFFKCFIGDTKIVTPRIQPKDLAALAKLNNSNNALLIRASS